MPGVVQEQVSLGQAVGQDLQEALGAGLAVALITGQHLSVKWMEGLASLFKQEQRAQIFEFLGQILIGMRFC